VAVGIGRFPELLQVLGSMIYGLLASGVRFSSAWLFVPCLHLSLKSVPGKFLVCSFAVVSGPKRTRLTPLPMASTDGRYLSVPIGKITGP
jgi:hypothetical protein